MWRKIVALFLWILWVNVLMILGVFPRFGTLGFLITINLVQIVLFLSHHHEVWFVRHAYALTFSLLSVLASVLAVFRTGEVTLSLLGFSSIGMSLIAWY